MLDDKSYQKTWRSCSAQWPWWCRIVRSLSGWNLLLAASSGILTFPKSSSRCTNCARSSSPNRSVCPSVWCLSLCLSVSCVLSVSPSLSAVCCLSLSVCCVLSVSLLCLCDGLLSSLFFLFVCLFVEFRTDTCLVSKRIKAITKELLSDAIGNHFHRNVLESSL